MPGPTVAAGFARGLFDYAVAKGLKAETLAQRSGIELSELDDPNRRIPLANYATLMRAAKELCRDPALALHFGESPYSETSVGCRIGLFAETGAEAFALMNRYSRLNVDVECAAGDQRFVVQQIGGRLWIVDTRTNADDFPELTELTFACMVCAPRRLYGDRSFVSAIHVTHPAPAYRAEYERMFRVPIAFGREHNALMLADDALLAERSPFSSQVVLDVLTERAEELLNSVANDASSTSRVERTLKRVLQTGQIGMPVIAAKLGMSRQTLFRRLRAEGTTFERVLDGLRSDLALEYLVRRNIPVNETGYLLGFSDPGAFSRAFKRWTGSRPSGVRAANDTNSAPRRNRTVARGR